MDICEIWLPIKGYEGRYEVSNLGNIRRLGRFISTGAFLKQQLLVQSAQKNGYYRVALYSPIDNKPHKYLVHRLVAMAFVEGYREGLEVNHIDENKANNKANNLEWITSKQNTNYGTCIKRRAETRGKTVYQCSLEGELLTKFVSIKKAAKSTKIDRNKISDCCNNKRATAGGFLWSFAAKETKINYYKDKRTDSLFVNLEGEIWKTIDINGDVYPNYEVSNKGRIRSVPRKGYSKCYKLCHPYFLRGRAQMTLKKDGRKFKTMVSRIVAFAFCKGYQSGYQANHIDENPLNDCADNLEWVSCKENINYGSRTDKVIKKRSKKVAQMDDSGNVIKVFPSIKDASKMVGGRIKKVCDGKQLKANGYKWKYVD